MANDTLVADAIKDAANLTTIVTATQLANDIAASAAASGANSLLLASPKAVYVFDTADQTATYNRLTMDERNLADLKSDVNNTNNFFNTTLNVNYKGIESSVVVAGTNYKTTDLQINQAIKQAINSDVILNKLLLVTDGPANSLIVTSLIDGTHTTANLAVKLTMPTTVTQSDITGAAAAYGNAGITTSQALLDVLAASKLAFDTKGDYTTQFAESGANGGNTLLVGANSFSTSDNTITPGTGNDVIVLGTTVRTDLLTSSNEKVIYSGLFGDDTIVNFAVAGNGADILDFSALNGRGANFGSFVTDKSIVVGAVGTSSLTTGQIAALFTDSIATAVNHVYVAVDATNIGSIYQVADAAGAGGITVTLVGHIDLADTAWGTLTGSNFV